MLNKTKDHIIELPPADQDCKIFPAEITQNSRCSSQSSGIGSNGDICRICHCESTPDAPLITPCYCSGSLRYVHQACLQQWIKSSNIRCCELCKFQFIMQTKIKPFNEWEYLEMSGLERKKLLCAMLFHVIAMTCVCWSLYVLIDRTLDEVQRGNLDWPFWTKLIVVGIGFMGGVVFMYIQCKAYFILCKRWKAYNRVIYVQNAPEKPPRRLSGRNCAEDEKELPSTVSYPSLKPYGGGGISVRTLNNKDFFNCQIPSSPSSNNTGVNNAATSCMDIKGVRNLHIFFNEDNRIRFHKQDIPSPCSRNPQQQQPTNHLQRSDVADDDRDVLRNYNSTMPNNNKLVCNNASWHIEIDNKPKDTNLNSADENSSHLNSHRSDSGSNNNVDANITSDNNNACAVCPNGFQLKIDNDNNIDRSSSPNAVTNNNSDSDKSPIVTLQIKKSEIFIEFGQQTERDINDDVSVETDDKSVFSNSPEDANKLEISSTAKNDSSNSGFTAACRCSDSAPITAAFLTIENVSRSSTVNPIIEDTITSSSSDEDEIEKRIDASDDQDIGGSCHLATSKLLTKNHSSASLMNVQQKQQNTQTRYLTDWNSNDNLLSIP